MGCGPARTGDPGVASPDRNDSHNDSRVGERMTEHAHAPMSPSSKYRWKNCPHTARRLEDKGGAAALEGTVVHELVEKRSRGEDLGKVEPEAQRAIDQYFEIVDGIPGEKHFEIKLESAILPEDYWGTADCVVVSGKAITIVDFKYGRRAVWAKDNDQLLAYMSMARDLFGPRKEYHAWIVQPRVHAPDHTTFTDAQLDADIMAVLDAANSDEKCAGTWCTFCPLRTRCKEAWEWTVEQARRTFSDEWTNEQCLEIESTVKAVQKLAEDASALLLRRALNGVKVEGYKVALNRGNRTWIDGDVAEEKLKEIGAEGIFTDPKLKTPTKLEEEGVDKDVIAQLVHRPKRGPVLVPEGSSLPDYVVDATEFFDNLENENE